MVDWPGRYWPGKIGSRSTVVAPMLLGVMAIVTLAACTTTVSSSPETETSTADATETPATVRSTTTQPPATTDRPTTTQRPTTTDKPTTTRAPTTTEPPPPPPPANIVAVEPVAGLVATGSDSGGETARIQQRLADLGFWLSGVDGSYGLTTLQAVMAFQKYAGLPASGEVDEATAGALGGMTERARARADAGTLVEIDKARQLLFLVVDGQTRFVFNTSTGNGEEYTEPDQNTTGEEITGVSLTPDGFHKVWRERQRGWWEGDLGQIYRPKYFVGGVAVHGSNSVPNYPASHGCVRVTVEAMDFIWAQDLMPMGTFVWVHERGAVA